MACGCSLDPLRSNAPATKAAARPGPNAGMRTCLECGEPFGSAVAGAEFCGNTCRMAFNNRRAKRGAEVYDLLMSLRHDRQTATVLKVWTLISRLAAIYREEDRTERAGRRSWRHPSEIIARRPYLRAERLRQSRRRPD